MSILKQSIMLNKIIYTDVVAPEVGSTRCE